MERYNGAEEKKDDSQKPSQESALLQVNNTSGTSKVQENKEETSKVILQPNAVSKASLATALTSSANNRVRNGEKQDKYEHAKPVFPVQPNELQTPPVRVIQKAEQVQPMKASVITPMACQNGQVDGAITSVKKSVEGGRTTHIKPTTQSYVSKSPVIVHNRGVAMTTEREEEEKRQNEALKAREAIQVSSTNVASLRRDRETEINDQRPKEKPAKKFEFAKAVTAQAIKSVTAQEPSKAPAHVTTMVQKDPGNAMSVGTEEVTALKQEIENLRAANDKMVRNYEEQINAMRKQLEQAAGQDLVDAAMSPKSSVTSDGEASPDLSRTSSPVTPPPPPPPVPGAGPPPPPPLGGIRGAGSNRKLRKAAVKPDVEMKQLFWTRYLVG